MPEQRAENDTSGQPRKQPYRIAEGERYFLDADGFCWREVWVGGEMYHSMARVNPDNSPTPTPLLYLVPEREALWGAPWHVRLSYWLRPYDSHLDRRRWRWQESGCSQSRRAWTEAQQ